jgi:hypothetical protein
VNPVLGALSIAVGVAVFAATVLSIGRTLIVPRGLSPRLRGGLDWVVRGLFRWIARRSGNYYVRDRILTYEGPFRLLALLLQWLLLALVGYSLVLWPFAPSFPKAVALAGSAMFTLGFIPVGTTAPIGISFAAALTGLSLVALQIAYLPTLYAAFNRRETLVTMLASRAGQPPWGPEVLSRHALIDNLGDLPRFFGEWEMWAADVAESHTNYPVLIAFRSPHPLRSWVVALNAVMDAAALYLAVAPGVAPSEANAFLRMGYIALREIATVLRVPFEPDPLPDDPIDLRFDEFAAGLRVMDEAGFPRERTPEDAWPHYHGWRVNYESLTYRIADRFESPPALWSGPRHGLAVLAIPPIRPVHRHPDEERPHSHAVGVG